MGRDSEYTTMKQYIDNMRNPLLMEEILGDKSGELEQSVMDRDNVGKKISLDNSVNANIVTDSGEEVPDVFINDIQELLNNFIGAVQGFVTIQLITVHLEKTIIRITVNVMMSDNQPASVHISSDKEEPQLKYDNFLSLNAKNIQFMAAVRQSFNSIAMQQFKGAANVNL